MNHQQLDKIVQDTRRYWFVDGLTEIAFGGVGLVLAGYFYLTAVLPGNSLLVTELKSGFAILIIAVVLAANWLVKRLKARLTAPRTGYVAFARPSTTRKLISALTGALIAAMMILLVTNAPRGLDWMVLVTGLGIGIGLAIPAYRTQVHRFYLLAAWSVLSGAALAILNLKELEGLACFYLLMGMVCILSGRITLRAYLRQNALSGEAGDGE